MPGPRGGGRHLRLRPALVRGGRDRRRAARPRRSWSGTSSRASWRRGRWPAGAWPSTRRSRASAATCAARAIRTSARRSGSPGTGAGTAALRQYLSWPTHRLHPLPDSLDGVAGALLEPLGVAIHAVDLGHVDVAARVAIIGCGPIGLLLAQVCAAAGATVALAVDPLEHRRAAATRAGAETVIGPGELDAWDGAEVDVAFEAAGTDEAVDLALRAARPGARVVLAGIPAGDQTTFSASIARRKGLTLVLVRRMKEVYPRALRLAEAGAVDLQSLVTHRFPLDRAPEAFEVAVAREGLKVVVEP